MFRPDRSHGTVVGRPGSLGKCPQCYGHAAGLASSCAPPTYQYAARFLLYRQGSIWDLVRPDRIATEIGRRLPAHLRDGWRLIDRGRVTADNEHLAVPAASWIAEHGEPLGFRAPNARERARAAGVAPYADELGLSGRGLYDVVGRRS